jgi:hypothetical protein
MIELNDDFYTSVDIQGYKCFPRRTSKQNPLQYVVSFNPPLMFTNYIMNPLEIYEIDHPGKRYQITKDLFKIPPSMSNYIIQLNLSKENKSEIKFQITDTVQNSKLTTIIANMGLRDSVDQNEARK